MGCPSATARLCHPYSTAPCVLSLGLSPGSFKDWWERVDCRHDKRPDWADLLKTALLCPHRCAACYRPEIRMATPEGPCGSLDDGGVDHMTPLAARSGVEWEAQRSQPAPSPHHRQGRIHATHQVRKGFQVAYEQSRKLTLHEYPSVVTSATKVWAMLTRVTEPGATAAMNRFAPDGAPSR